MANKKHNQPETNQPKTRERSYHRPISIFVETVDKLPYEKTLPTETQLTINLKFTRTSAMAMILFLQNELERNTEHVALTITGPAP